MRLLVFGGCGMLGRAVFHAAAYRGWYAGRLGRDEADVTHPDEVRVAIEQWRPDVVVNCAAFHNVDACEADPALAYAVNSDGAMNVLRAAPVGCQVVHISTGYVFDGRKSDPYTEDDAPNPLQVYGHSKWAGERRLRDADVLIVRTSALFGGPGNASKGGSFVDRMLARARAGETLRVVADQWVTPTHVGDLAAGIVSLVEAGAHGIVHLTNAGGTTWWGIAAETVRLAGLDPDRVVPIATPPGGVPRPANSLLDCSKAMGWAVGWQPIHLRSWQEALADYVGAREAVQA